MEYASNFNEASAFFFDDLDYKSVSPKDPEQMLYSPLEPLVFGSFSTDSYDPLLDESGYSMPPEETPPLSSDLGSATPDSFTSSPLLASPIGDMDMPLFSLQTVNPALLPQPDAGLAPLDVPFTLDAPFALEPTFKAVEVPSLDAEVPSMEEEVVVVQKAPASGAKRTKKQGAKKRAAPARAASAEAEANEGAVPGETEVEARRRKAREAQRKCRAKKQAHVEGLEFQVAALESEQERLLEKRDALRAALAAKERC